MLCMALNMKPVNFRTFQNSIESIDAFSLEEVNNNLAMARNEVRKTYSKLDDENDAVVDITVSYDGSWQKRGLTPKYGIGCCIEMLTGLNVDFEVLSKSCNQCEVKKRQQPTPKSSQYCTIVINQNYVGSSPGMEVEAAERLWRRSDSLGFRYKTMLTDGDARTVCHFYESKVYGDLLIEKVECLNHVTKRLGTELKKLVRDRSKSETRIGGRALGHLTEPVIKKTDKVLPQWHTQKS